MSEEAMRAFKAEINLIEEHAGLLELGDLYLAGVLKASTSHSLPNILKSLLVLRQSGIAEDPLDNVLLLFYQGKIRVAQELLKELNLKSRVKSSLEHERVNPSQSTVARVELGMKPPKNVDMIRELEAYPGEAKLKIHRDKLMRRERERLESERFAKQLQDQFDAEEHKVVVQPDPMCAICLDPIKEQDYMPLETCGHMLHPSCINEFLTLQVNDRKFPITCPIPECKLEVSIIDIQYRLEPQVYQKFEEYSFNSFVQRHAADMSCCPTPDCKYAFVWTGESPHFLCPICEKHYCLDCRCEYHDGISCEEHRKLTDVNELDKMFERFVQGVNYKQCPQCRFWVEKVDGCDTMTCNCGFGFCYNCGNSVYACSCGHSYH
mmetsp:Transcript_7311/g.13514  ORF Transcript_7311/g.13514 Transcript_7311/m.13514 type:complete len:378 (+) Transcript_7311:127-1260(+)